MAALLIPARSGASLTTQSLEVFLQDNSQVRSEVHISEVYIKVCDQPSDQAIKLGQAFSTAIRSGFC